MRHLKLILPLLLASIATLAAAQRQTNAAALRQIAEIARHRAESKKEEALFLARMRGLPEFQILPNGKVVELMEFRRGKPVYLQTDNVNAALSTRANRVHPGGAAGLSLTGLGVTLGIWDGGTVRTTHQEYTGRVALGDAEPRSGDHASHVAGTMIASGVSANAKGMSYQATLESRGWNSDESEMATAAAAGLRLSNHSYGYITGWYSNGVNWYWYGDTTVSTTEDNGFGYYDSTAQSWDTIAYNAPYYLINKSAGNDRNQGPGGQPVSHYDYDNTTQTWVLRNDSHGLDGNSGTGHDSISYNSVAKNILTVGAVNDVLNYTGPGSVTMSSFSGWGPTDDGRIKPDVVGNGVSLYSSFGGTDIAYGTYSGTSMSTPNVTGSLGLLVQHHRNLKAGADMLAATLKALTIHTADECGAAVGPDYQFGFGLVNVERAAQTITQDVARPETLTEDVIANGQTRTFSVYSDGTQPLRATIVWTDPAGTPAPWSLDPSTRMLVNDLDLRVTGPGGTSMPWVLNPASPGSAATTGDNDRDNVEQVLVAAPTAGTYTITVTHKGASLAPAGSQAFSLVITGQGDSPSAPVLTSLSLSASTIGGGNSVTGTVTLSNTAGGTVTLSSSNGAATVPASVTVPSGSASANFTINTSAVAATTSATITASMDGVDKTQNLQVRAASLVSVSVNPSTVLGGAGSTGTVTVSGNIPAGGITINIWNDSPNVDTPDTVSIAQGQTSTTFAVTTLTVSTNETATITAGFDGNTQSTSLNVQTANVSLNSVSVSPTAVFERNNSTGTVTLSGAAPAGGVVVSLSEAGGTSTLILPSTVTVPAGSSSATFTIGTNNVGSSAVTRTIQAVYNGTTRTASLTVNPILVSTLTIAPTSVRGGTSATGTVTINGAAGIGGAVVNLSDNSAFASVPASVTVPQGATSVTFTITTTRPSKNQTATITATRNGSSRSATLQIRK